MHQMLLQRVLDGDKSAEIQFGESEYCAIIDWRDGAQEIVEAVASFLPDGYLEKVDKATMATSLEGRLPFLDHRLVELAFQIPSALKIRGFATKQILKQAVADLIPAEVLRRPKHGFAVPTDPWFRGELSGYAREILLDDRTRRRGWFNVAVVERLWNEHRSGRHAWDTQLWLLLVFELWQRVTLDGDGI
jgi:asparagine synthase (glutamine-hydrolysing)